MHVVGFICLLSTTPGTSSLRKGLNLCVQLCVQQQQPKKGSEYGMLVQKVGCLSLEASRLVRCMLGLGAPLAVEIPRDRIARGDSM